MAFPGDRRRKVDITILADAITGALNFDLPVTITHADFVDASKTLDGVLAMKQGGADLAFSLDEAGSTRLALEVVRCELSATPADSRIELKVTVPADIISDTVDTVIWAWFGSETETLPADADDYGKHDVWNGPAREGFAPLVTWGAWHFDENPSDPAPQWKNSASTSHNISASSNGTPTRVDQAPGRGLQMTGVANQMVTASASGIDSPGLSDWAVLCCVQLNSEWTVFSGDTDYNNGRQIYLADNYVSMRFKGLEGIFYITDGLGAPWLLSASRHGGDIVTCANEQNSTITGAGSLAFTYTGDLDFLSAWSAAGTVLRYSFLSVLSVAPNVHWLRALYDNLVGGTLLGTPQDSQPAAITAYCEFQGLQSGTEVRLYEEPHGQWWSADLDGVTPSALNSKYIAFQIQGSSSSADHYVWFNYNSTGTDPEPGGTGHAVAIATTDTAADVADTLQGVLDALTDLTAAVDGTLVTALNDRNGELAEPTHNSTATVSLIQVGGIATDEIDGIESSTGTTWTATYQILRPRRATVVMLSIAYERVRYSIILTTAGSVQPAGALQREDPNYSNPA